MFERARNKISFGDRMEKTVQALGGEAIEYYQVQ